MNTENLTKYKSFVVPAGSYYLCDPCYIVKDAGSWVKFLQACAAEDSGRLSGHYESLTDDVNLLVFDTPGDGGYEDQHGNSYSVDSGLLGLIPCGYSPDYDSIDKVGKKVDFTEDTLCFTKDGILTFGNYIIDTQK